MQFVVGNEIRHRFEHKKYSNAGGKSDDEL